jgi:predicted deacylase
VRRRSAAFGVANGLGFAAHFDEAADGDAQQFDFLVDAGKLGLVRLRRLPGRWVGAGAMLAQNPVGGGVDAASAAGLAASAAVEGGRGVGHGQGPFLDGGEEDVEQLFLY